MSSSLYGVLASDPAAWTLDVFGAAEIVEAGLMAGPRLYSSGTTVFNDSNSYPQFRPIDTPQEARTVIEALGRFQPALVKEYGQKRRDRRRARAGGCTTRHR